jgi:hypothetical protein
LAAVALALAFLGELFKQSALLFATLTENGSIGRCCERTNGHCKSCDEADDTFHHDFLRGLLGFEQVWASVTLRKLTIPHSFKEPALGGETNVAR